VKENTQNPKVRFPLVGLGASAGGLEALEQFFAQMPADAGIGFVVIQHLDPKHKALLPELLQRDTAMKVVEATDLTTVEPNHVYVIPPQQAHDDSRWGPSFVRPLHAGQNNTAH
jgi:two-component system CheB/CheR fusion protein